MQQPKVTVLGSANVDLVIRAERMPNKGETLIGNAFDIFTGGKGFNQATAAARLGADVTFIGRIGNDVFGEMLRSAMETENIDTRFVNTDAESGTGVATIVVEPDGDNSIIDSIANADVLLLQLETPIDASQCAAEIARDNGTIVMLDPAPARSLPDDFLDKIDILKPNTSEATVLSGQEITTPENRTSAAQKLQTQIVQDGLSTVVLTLGEQGVLLCTPTETEHIPAIPVDAVDTTGAGDAFSGALATSIANGSNITESVKFAVAAGAAAVTVLGATPSMPTNEKIESII